jgi:hypothetical protein
MAGGKLVRVNVVRHASWAVYILVLGAQYCSLIVSIVKMRFAHEPAAWWLGSCCMGAGDATIIPCPSLLPCNSQRDLPDNQVLPYEACNLRQK